MPTIKNVTHEEKSEYDGTPVNLFTVRTTGETSYLCNENSVVSNIIYVKVSGAWAAATKVYKKVNGSWVEQSDLANVFIEGVNYVKR